MRTRTARCSCGDLRVHCEEEPVRISICHCFECQTRTGSVYGTQARFIRAHVRIEGPSTKYQRTGDAGSEIDLHFCPRCGSTVYWIIGGMEEFVMVGVGAFEDSSFPSPTVAVYEDRQHAWAAPTIEMEHYD